MQKNKVFKFDGIDGCGKSTLMDSAFDILCHDYKISKVKEFGDASDKKVEYWKDKISLSQVLRKFVVDEIYGLDEIEREMLWSVMSRRTNRVVIPKLQKDNDVIMVDRSEIGNYTYGLSLNPKFKPLYDLALEGIVLPHTIFWVDTPIELCMERIVKRNEKLSYNEKKGITFFKIVKEQFEKYCNANPNIIRLDGSKELPSLTNEVVRIVLSRIS